MQNGFRPLGTYGISKIGMCALCGVAGPLSKTHVPPEKAGNHQPSATMGTRAEKGLAQVQPGTLRDGGTWAWLLCEPCNQKVGKHDEEFIRWWYGMVRSWSEVNEPKAGEFRTGRLPNSRPGAFIRSVLGGMFALNPNLRTRCPNVAAAILSGDPVALPNDLQLMMSLYWHGNRYVLGKMTMVVTETDFSSSTSLSVEGEWPWPPFHLALVDPSKSDYWPEAMNISAWLLEEPDVARDVEMSFGVLGVDDLFMSRFRNEQ